MWNMWKAPQKIYNGFENRWDCCSLLSDSPDEAELDSDDDHEDIYLTINPQPRPTADQTTPSIQSVGQLALDTRTFPCLTYSWRNPSNPTRKTKVFLGDSWQSYLENQESWSSYHGF